MKICNHIIEANFRARQPWTHFRIHPIREGSRFFGQVYGKHLVWGRLSLTWGQPHLMPVRCCTNCLEEIQVINAGDEYWDYCESCQQIEGDTVEMTMEEFEARQ